MSPGINVGLHPKLFICLLLTVLLNKCLWLGYDPWITEVAGDPLSKQVTLRGGRVEYPAVDNIKSVEGHTFMLVYHIFSAYSLQGRHTWIWLIQDTLENYYIMKDCWLPTLWMNDVTIHHLLQDKSCEDPMFMLDVRGHGHEAIFNSEDTYHIFEIGRAHV